MGPGWSAARKSLQMGRFDARDGKTVKIAFFIEEDEDTFQFTDARVEPAVLDVSWAPDAEFDSPSRNRIWIELVAAPGMTPARFVRAHPIEVTLSTNDPEVPEWTFSVLLQAN